MNNSTAEDLERWELARRLCNAGQLPFGASMLWGFWFMSFVRMLQDFLLGNHKSAVIAGICTGSAFGISMLLGIGWAKWRGPQIIQKIRKEYNQFTQKRSIHSDGSFQIKNFECWELARARINTSPGNVLFQACIVVLLWIGLALFEQRLYHLKQWTALYPICACYCLLQLLRSKFRQSDNNVKPLIAEIYSKYESLKPLNNAWSENDKHSSAEEFERWEHARIRNDKNLQEFFFDVAILGLIIAVTYLLLNGVYNNERLVRELPTIGIIGLMLILLDACVPYTSAKTQAKTIRTKYEQLGAKAVSLKGNA